MANYMSQSVSFLPQPPANVDQSVHVAALSKNTANTSCETHIYRNQKPIFNIQIFDVLVLATFRGMYLACMSAYSIANGHAYLTYTWTA